MKKNINIIESITVQKPKGVLKGIAVEEDLRFIDTDFVITVRIISIGKVTKKYLNDLKNKIQSKFGE